MMDVAALPCDVQRLIFDWYLSGVRLRMLRLRGLVLRQISTVLGADTCDHVLDWLAHAVQYPTSKPKIAIALWGHRRGQETLVDLVSQLLPTLAMHDTALRNWASHPALETSKAIVVYDPVPSRSLADLKALIQDDAIAIRLPQQPVRVIHSVHRVLIVLTNDRPLSQRQVLAARCAAPTGDRLNTAAVNAFRQYLMKREISQMAA